MRRLLILAAFVSLASSVSIAHADEASDALARNHFEAGRAYFERARYEDAAREFQEAWELSPRPSLLLNLARAYESGGHPDQAIEALTRWTEVAPSTDPMRAEVDARLGRLRAEAAARAAAATSNPPPTAPVVASPAVDDAPAERTSLFWIGTGAVGLAGASGAILLVTGLRASAIHDDLEEVCMPADACPASRGDDITRGERLARTSTAFTVIGLSAAAGGAVLMILGRDGSDDDEPSVLVVPEATTTSVGLRAFGRF